MADRDIDQWKADRLERLEKRQEGLLAAASVLRGPHNKEASERANKALHEFLFTLVGEDVPLPEGWQFADSNQDTTD